MVLPQRFPDNMEAPHLPMLPVTVMGVPGSISHSPALARHLIMLTWLWSIVWACGGGVGKLEGFVTAGFLELGTDGILGQRTLLCGSCLHIVGCLATSLTYTLHMPVAPPPRDCLPDNTKCPLHTLHHLRVMEESLAFISRTSKC